MTRTISVPQVLYRTGTSENAPDGVIRLSISSDVPYKRYDYWNDEEYWEVLDHSPGGMDMGRLKEGTALLFNHQRNIQLGTINNPTLEKGRCYVDAKVSRAPDVESYRVRIEENILKDTSVGYEIVGDGVCTGEKDGLPVFRFRWAPHEASLVTIPADTGVGVGRERGKQPEETPRVISIQERELDNSDNKSQTNVPAQPPAQPSMKINHTVRNHFREADTGGATGGGDKPTIDVSAVRNEALTTERKRVRDIQDLSAHFRDNGLGGRKIDTAELATKCINDGKSCQEFQDAVVRGNFAEPKPVVEFTPELGMSEREKKEFSLVRAMRCLAGSRPLDGIEKEASVAQSKLLGKEVDGIGFFIPEDIMRGTAVRNFNRTNNEHIRALFAGTFSGAGGLIADDLSAFSLIELLRNQMLVTKMGARNLSGLKGNVPIPRQTGGATASWLAEDSTISATQQVVGQLNLTPHKLAAATAYTQQLLAQSSIDVENFVRQDLMAVIALERDRAALNGSGVSGQPLGILNTSNLSTNVTLASAESLTYAKAIAFETNVSLNNANAGRLGYMTSIGAKANAKQLAEIASTNSNPVWKGDVVNGYPAFATNQVPTANGVIFGNWDDLILASWGETSVIVDPFSLSLQGQVRIVFQMMCDNGLRHTQSFAKGVL
jgi:HK97 family phage major capsid protein